MRLYLFGIQLLWEIWGCSSTSRPTPGIQIQTPVCSQSPMKNYDSYFLNYYMYFVHSLWILYLLMVKQKERGKAGRTNGGQMERKGAKNGIKMAKQRNARKDRHKENEGRREWKTEFGKRLRREGVDFAGEWVSSRLRIPIKTWPPFRSTLRVCVWACINHNVGTVWICPHDGDLKSHFWTNRFSSSEGKDLFQG